MERVHLIIYGMVQGVFFRSNTQKEAARLGISGWVRNTPDGAVEAVAEGPKDALESFVAWCRRGPPYARVDRVDTSWEPSSGLPSGFHIRY